MSFSPLLLAVVLCMCQLTCFERARLGLCFRFFSIVDCPFSVSLWWRLSLTFGRYGVVLCWLCVCWEHCCSIVHSSLSSFSLLNLFLPRVAHLSSVWFLSGGLCSFVYRGSGPGAYGSWRRCCCSLRCVRLAFLKIKPLNRRRSS